MCVWLLILFSFLLLGHLKENHIMVYSRQKILRHTLNCFTIIISRRLMDPLKVNKGVIVVVVCAEVQLAKELQVLLA